MSGAKTSWFFLRGLVRESGHWNGFVDRFAAAFPDTETVELDLPGSGAHFDRKSPASVPAIVDWLRNEFLRRKGARNALFAISLGGMVGIDWMQRYPGDFERAVLVNTSLRGLSPFYRRMQPHNYWTVLRLMASGDVLFRERRILEMTSNRFEHHERIATEWAEIQRRHPVSVPNSVRQLLAAARYRPSPEPPRAKILVLSSRGDRLVHPSCSDRLASLWRLQLLVHPDAGHDLTLDDPDWVLDKVREFEQKS
jgi:pimeloyl-ACP methyl ester carboxylesterase